MWNRIRTVLAAAMIVAGLAAFAYQGGAYSSRPPFDPADGIPLPPIIGVIVLIVGIALLLMDARDFQRAAKPKRPRHEGGSR